MIFKGEYSYNIALGEKKSQWKRYFKVKYKAKR